MEDQQQANQRVWRYFTELIKEDPKVGFIVFLIIVLIALVRIHQASENDWKRKETEWILDKQRCDSSKFALLLWFRDRFEVIDSTQQRIQANQAQLFKTIGK